ncbi:short chain oxidoreductase [Irpex lacteus]|nr:short chain oxidoreductase [Irpex lacteus]
MSSRVALVTGAAQGIGKAIALRLAKDGLNVGILDLRGKEDQMKAVAEEITAVGRQSYCVVGNVSNEDSIAAAVNGVVEHLGQLDVMVANAGISPNVGTTILDTTVNEWNSIFDTNALGTMLCFKYAAKQMIRQGSGGRLIGACSLAGKQGMPKVGAYSASKFAVRGLTHVMAKELKDHKITVNSYAPGMVSTALIEHSRDNEFGGRGAAIKALLGIGEETPIAEPDDVANLVAHLVSTKSGFITGQIISVDGGMSFD